MNISDLSPDTMTIPDTLISSGFQSASDVSKPFNKGTHSTKNKNLQALFALFITFFRDTCFLSYFCYNNRSFLPPFIFYTFFAWISGGARRWQFYSYLVQFHLISNGGQRVVLVFNKVHCLAHENLPPATFYLRSPAEAEIQNAGAHRIIRTSLFLDLRVKPEDDKRNKLPEDDKEEWVPGVLSPPRGKKPIINYFWKKIKNPLHFQKK